jgi:hypothetical protein
VEDLDNEFVFAASLLADYCEKSINYYISEDIFYWYVGGPFSAEDKLFYCCAAYLIVYWRTDCGNHDAKELRDLVCFFCFERLDKKNWTLDKLRLGKIAKKFKTIEVKSVEDICSFLNGAPLGESLTSKLAASLLE